MAFQPIKCPHCNESLQIPDDKESVNCMFCSKKIIVAEVLKTQNHTTNLDSLFTLAESALEGDNFEEAYKYYSRILELDTTNPPAWLGKGVSAGPQSFDKINEMLVAFKNAIQFAPDEEKESYRERVGYALKLVLMPYYAEVTRLVEIAIMERNNLVLDYGSRVMATKGSLIILRALEQTHKYIPSDTDIINGIINLCNGLKQAKGSLLNSLDIEQIEQLMSKYVAKMKKLDTSYTESEPEENKSCFVVTATMGSNQHPRVIILRNFRDNVLNNYPIGRAFIKWYNSNGPKIASHIQKSWFLKQLSYALIVFPVSEIAKYLIKQA